MNADTVTVTITRGTHTLNELLADVDDPRLTALLGTEPVLTIPYDPHRVRQWARDEGRDVPERGRLSHDLILDYMRTLSSPTTDTEAPAIRQWARDNGIPIGTRGKISSAVRRQWKNR